MEKIKLFKKKALKALPFVLGAIPGAAAVVNVVNASKAQYQAALMVRDADLIQAQGDMSLDYMHNVCDLIRARLSTAGDQEAFKQAYSKVYGMDGVDYQAEWAFLGEDGQNAIEEQIQNIFQTAKETTNKELGLNIDDYVNDIHGTHTQDMIDTYVKNLHEATDVAEANFGHSDYMNSLAESFPTVGEYFDTVHAADASWNWSATMGAAALAVGCTTKLIIDHKTKKVQKEIEQNKKEDEKSL